MPRMKLRAFLQSTWSWLRRPLTRFPRWPVSALVGTVLGLQLAFVILLLEPDGTDRYQASWRSVRLAGYGVSLWLPFVLGHVLERAWLRGQGGRWFVYNVLIGKTLLTVAALSATYLYFAFAIAGSPVSMAGWLRWLGTQGTAYLPLMLPVGIWLYLRLLARFHVRLEAPRPGVSIQGRNRDENLQLSPRDFLYAQAQENYVTVYYRTPEGERHRILRATLGEIAAQIPQAVRIHRSYLIDPRHVVALEGNARKRIVRLAGVEQALPVSARFDAARLVRQVSPADAVAS